MKTVSAPKTNTFVGLFLTTLSTLMYEILLTRIFSVTMWYHFAFMSISIAMFGMTLGALIVYIFPVYFKKEKAHSLLSLSSLIFSLSAVVSFLIHIKIPFYFELTLRGILSIVVTYIVVSIPFIFSGICVCIALTKFPRYVSKLYAADLAGAAFGCILLIYTLGYTDGPTSVIIVAIFACLGSIFFSLDNFNSKIMKIAVVCIVILISFAGVNTFLAREQSPLLRLKWVKGKVEQKPVYVKWNSFSRITVFDFPGSSWSPTGWGLSTTFPSSLYTVKQLALLIDADAGTVLTEFNGDLSKLKHLKYDIVNLVHYLRHNADVLVIGTGGGKDILSALAFNQKSVVGIEINNDIIYAVNKKFGDFTGHLDRNPKVTFINDEARSYIARQKRKYDIIQISLIDTWAATAAGAFVLTENSLYTVEAWKTFLKHLKPNGILTISRWYFKDRPGEIYRLASLASATLLQMGIKNPRDNILIVKNLPKEQAGGGPDGVGTIIVSKDPFSGKDITTIKKVVRDMDFEMVLSPDYSLDSTFAAITSGKDIDRITKEFPLDISPPTDDSPFFFHMLRLRNMFNRKLWNQGVVSFNMKAVFILGLLLIVTTVLTSLCIILPLILKTKRNVLKKSIPLLAFFAAIGFGFILIEISQMQRLIIFLGHPTYSLSVVLFSLLLSSGIGSYTTRDTNKTGIKRSGLKRLFFLLCILVIFGLFTPYATGFFRSSTTPVRILVAVIILFPIGLFMGMAFPFGMKVASARTEEHLTPWFWGINGATSVTGSVLAVAIAINSSISTAYWVGFSCYVVSYITFMLSTRALK